MKEIKILSIRSNGLLIQVKVFYCRCPPEFVYLYREFGGNLWIRDSRQRLATEISDRAPALALMKQLQGKIVCIFIFDQNKIN